MHGLGVQETWEEEEIPQPSILVTEEIENGTMNPILEPQETPQSSAVKRRCTSKPGKLIFNT